MEKIKNKNRIIKKLIKKKIKNSLLLNAIIIAC